MNVYNKIELFKILFLIFLGSLSCISQNSINTAGLDVKSDGGSICYSIGIANYNSYQKDSFNITEGVQQNFEIFLLNNEFSLILYPNPSADYINLVFEYDVFKDLYYSIMDIHGKIVKNQIMNSYVTTIPLDNLQSGIYFVTIYDQVKVYGTKKIIKK